MGSPNNSFKVGDGYACCWICFCQVDRSLLTEGVTVEETHHSKEDLDLLRDHYHRNEKNAPAPLPAALAEGGGTERTRRAFRPDELAPQRPRAHRCAKEPSAPRRSDLFR